MSDGSSFLFLFLVFGVIPGFIGRWIAVHKRRSGREGLWLGLFLSFIGLVIEAVLPSGTDQPTPPKRI